MSDEERRDLAERVAALGADALVYGPFPYDMNYYYGKIINSYDNTRISDSTGTNGTGYR